jgi:hypothetical protein
MGKIALDSKDLVSVVRTAIKDEGSFTLTIKGTSMTPFFINGETCVTLEAFDLPRKNHVYLFKKDGKVHLHRLIKIKDDMLYFRGDALKSIETTLKGTVIAHVTSHHRFEKHFNTHSRMMLIKFRLWSFLGPFRTKVASILIIKR